MTTPSLSCPFDDGCGWTFGYPEGYRDPPWSTARDFGEVVLPARREALQKSLNEHLDHHGFTNMRWEWEPVP